MLGERPVVCWWPSGLMIPWEGIKEVCVVRLDWRLLKSWHWVSTHFDSTIALFGSEFDTKGEL